MASSSSSHQQNQECNAFFGIEPAGKRRKVCESSRLFDVFINHRAHDVNETLATQLYNSLEQLGIRVFLDSQEKELGNSFPSVIETAIRSAKVHIAIFSKRYAESAWCLAELVLMLQSEAKIIPVFYEVEPWELRHIEKGQYAAAFIKYEEEGRYLEKLGEWKEALQSLSFTAGEQVYSDRDCQKIAVAVQKEVQRKSYLHVAEYPVGLNNLVEDFEKRCLDELVQDFENQCELEEGKHKAKVVGIFGMGGSGKTTLAKELFNRKRLNYQRASFLFNVREASVTRQLPSLQVKLVKDLFDDNLSFTNTVEGIIHLKDRLQRKPPLSALVVVDDIDHVEQLNALGVMDILNNSLVIVTTRDVGVLITAGITVGYNLKGMDRNDGRELFCWHAFGQTHPASEYEGMVDAFVDVCGGLPLSLQVLGRHVHGRTQDYWRSELIKCAKTLPRDVKQRLKTSFDALDAEGKQVFMDIACFFIDEPKSIAQRVWEESGWNAQHALETLKDLCLVEEIKMFRGEFILRMHDHLRDLGREMALELGPPHRLWRSQDLKSLELMGLKFIFAKTNVRCFHSIFEESMGSQVSFFIGQSDICDETSASLIWLSFEGFSLRKFPSWLTLKKLRVLEFHGANELEELWEDNLHAPLQLRQLIIDGPLSSSFRRLPSSIGLLNHLKKIALLGYVGKEFAIKGLPEEFCDLQSLEHLELRHCTSLSSLPARFGNLRNLRHLDLYSCKALRNLPASFERLTRLQYLDLSKCKKLALQIDILENFTQLENLYLSGYLPLQELPHQITNKVFLKQLQLQNTMLRDLPSQISQLSKLEGLTIESPVITSLPETFGRLTLLEHLCINASLVRSLPEGLMLDKLEELTTVSPLLTSLPVSLGDLSSLKTLSIIGCIQLEYLPNTLGYLRCLEHLCIESSSLRYLPEGLTQLVSLQTLRISCCPLSDLDFRSGSLQSLRMINLSETHVTRVSISEDCCPSLETLQLSQNEYLEEIEPLPTAVRTIEL